MHTDTPHIFTWKRKIRTTSLQKISKLWRCKCITSLGLQPNNTTAENFSTKLTYFSDCNTVSLCSAACSRICSRRMSLFSRSIAPLISKIVDKRIPHNYAFTLKTLSPQITVSLIWSCKENMMLMQMIPTNNQNGRIRFI